MWPPLRVNRLSTPSARSETQARQSGERGLFVLGVAVLAVAGRGGLAGRATDDVTGLVIVRRRIERALFGVLQHPARGAARGVDIGRRWITGAQEFLSQPLHPVVRYLCHLS